MEKVDFVIKKLNYYLENFENLTDEELKQSNYFVLYKANEQINTLLSLVQESQEQNNELKELVQHYRNFIKYSNLTKRFELYSKRKEVI